MINNLYAELVTGTREHSEYEGVTTFRPPTSLSLRAAKALQELAGINVVNNALIQRLQLRDEEFVKEAAAMRQQIVNLISKQLKDTDESICEDRRPAGSMESGAGTQPDLFGCDSGSEAGNADSNSSTGGN